MGLGDVITFGFQVTAGPTPPGPCRCQSAACPIPPGWDKAHSDSDHSYSFEDLVRRQHAPHVGAYPTLEEYQQGFALWRAFRRDDRLNEAEEAVRFAGLESALKSREADLWAEAEEGLQ